MDPKASHAPLLSYAAGLAPERFTLRPSHPLLIVWLPFSLLAMGLALFGCLRYNAVAGPYNWRFNRTDLDALLDRLAAHEQAVHDLAA